MWGGDCFVCRLRRRGAVFSFGGWEREMVLDDSSRGFHPRTPGYFPHAGKVTKGALRERGISVSLSPSHYSPQEPRFTRGIAAATYAKNMPQAYFLNAAALARGATPRAALGVGCTARSGVRVLHRHCDYHTVVCSRLSQFDSCPRGEWLFAEVRGPQGAIFLAA